MLAANVDVGAGSGLRLRGIGVLVEDAVGAEAVGVTAEEMVWPNSSTKPSSDGGGFRVDERLKLGRRLGVLAPLTLGVAVVLL